MDTIELLLDFLAFLAYQDSNEKKLENYQQKDHVTSKTTNQSIQTSLKNFTRQVFQKDELENGDQFL